MPRLRLRVTEVHPKLCVATVVSVQASHKNPTSVRRLVRIAPTKFEEEEGVSVAVMRGDPVVIDLSMDDEPLRV